MTPIRDAYLVAAESVVVLLDEPDVAAQWSEVRIWPPMAPPR